MYKITIDETHAGYIEKPTFIYLNSKNGCFNICDEQAATGIVFNGEPYDLTGTAGCGVGKAAIAQEIDAADVLAAQRVELEQTITDLQLDNLELQVRVAELEGK